MGKKKKKKKKDALREAKAFVENYWASEGYASPPPLGTGAKALRESQLASTGALREALIREGII